METISKIGESYKRVCINCYEEGNIKEQGSVSHHGKWACACCVEHNNINWLQVMYCRLLK